MRYFFITLFFALTMWFSLHYWLHFEGWYGPAASKSIFAVYKGDFDWDSYTKVLSLVHKGFQIPPETAAICLSCIGYVCAYWGVYSLCVQWFPRSWMIIIALLLWHPLLMIGQLRGPDMLCIGIMILGITRTRTWIPIGGLLMGLSLSIKTIAAPLLCFLPFCLPRKILLPLFFVLLYSLRHHIEQLYFLPHAIPFLLNKIPLSTTVLFFVSVLIALHQKQSRTRNILILFTISLSAAMIAFHMGEKLRPRYLIAPSLPLLVLSFGLINRYTRGLRYALHSILLLLLFCDSWSFLYHWTQKFTTNEGISFSVPTPPRPIYGIHATLSSLTHSDHSAQGAFSLHTLGSQLSSGAAIIELRDTRHYHLLASLAKHNYPYRILSPEYCCRPSETISSCAIRIIQEMNQSGGTLIVPTTNGHRIKQGRQQWVDALLHEAQAYPSLHQYDSWWFVMNATYAQIPMPCAPTD